MKAAQASIAEKMAAKTVDRRLEYMDLSKIEAAPRNPKLHAQEDLGKSIGRFGFTEPVILDERTGRLVAGHGRVDSLRTRQQAGEAPPDGVKEKGTQWLIPVVRGWSSRSDTEADAYLLASNQLTTAGGWDELGLAQMLKELSEKDSAALEGVGFSDADSARLMDLLAKSDPGKVDFPSYDESAGDGVPMVECPKCGNKFPR